MALEPITRKEKIIAGQDLTPITRMENFLKNFGAGSIPKPLTYDYMPEGYPKKDGWSIEWDGNTEGLTYVPFGEGMGFYKISDFLPTDDELIGATLESSYGASLEITSNEINSSRFPGITTVESAILIVRQDNSIFNGITLSEKGVYTTYKSDGELYTKKLSNESITPMAREFLPSVVNELIMNSSTPNSTKKFKITVNDSGTISATEVT